MAKGWFNESKRHSLASRGISTAQRIKILSVQKPSKNKNVAIVRKVRLNILQELYNVEAGVFNVPDTYRPFFDQFSEKDSHYVPGDVFYTIADHTIPHNIGLNTYLRQVKGTVDKDKLRKIIYSKDKEIQKEVRELDMEILGFLSRNQDFKYKIVKDKEGNERLVTYTNVFKRTNPKFFKQLVKKVENE